MNLLSILESVFSLASRGGWVLIPIFCLGWFAWYLLLERYLCYRRLQRLSLKCFWNLYKNQGLESAKAFLKEKKKSYFAMLGEVVMNHYADGSEIVKYHLEEKQHQVSQELSKSMRSISVAASVAPLLGLLGTVSGMVHTFEIIEMFGFGNPVLLADGISEALLTTQAGLLVAFPLMLAYNHLSSRIERMEQEVWGEILKFEKVLQENLK